jgi:hypothetical protein
MEPDRRNIVGLDVAYNFHWDIRLLEILHFVLCEFEMSALYKKPWSTKRSNNYVGSKQTDDIVEIF